MTRDRRHAIAESAKGGWQHPSTYATAYDAYSEIAKIFNDKAEYEGCAAWPVHVACLLVMFCHGRLAMPTVDVMM